MATKEEEEEEEEMKEEEEDVMAGWVAMEMGVWSAVPRGAARASRSILSRFKPSRSRSPSRRGVMVEEEVEEVVEGGRERVRGWEVGGGKDEGRLQREVIGSGVGSPCEVAIPFLVLSSRLVGTVLISFLECFLSRVEPEWDVAMMGWNEGKSSADWTADGDDLDVIEEEHL